MLKRGKRCDYYLMRERRTRLKITYDVLHAIDKETDTCSGTYKGQTNIGLTRIQLIVQMAYDKIKKIMINLQKHGLLTIQPLKVTDRGFLFMHEYESIMKSVDRLQNNMVNLKDDNTEITISIEKFKARESISQQHILIDLQQVINAQNAIIQELEKNNE